MNSILHAIYYAFRNLGLRRIVGIDEIEVHIFHPRMIIKGTKVKNVTRDPDYPKFYAFLGIPYAKPPVQDSRFKPPQPYDDEPIEGPPEQKLCNDDDDLKCPQYVSKSKVVGNEDCLYLNIYLPKKPQDIGTKLPVLVYIHGGAFVLGSGNISDIRPDAIIRQNLVFVTVNYRLHIYGFLNMGTENCRGNAGLKDQVQALKWIQANISRFGGDPNNVTISGHSAGASCVNLHMISPLSRGLFHRAIVHSGGIYCPWGFLQNEQKVRNLFNSLMRTDQAHTVVSILKKKTQKELLDLPRMIIENTIQEQLKKTVVVMGPSLEVFKEGAFISDDIEKMKKIAEPVPLMAGMCEGEGYMYITTRGKNAPFRFWIDNDDEFDEFLMMNLHWSKESARSYRDELRDLYFPDRDQLNIEQIKEGIANFMTDVWFRRFYDSFNIGSSPEPFYVYKFCYVPPRDFTTNLATHGADILLLYKMESLIAGTGTVSLLNRFVMDTLCTMVGQFCKMGDFTSSIEVGNVEWMPHTKDKPCYLEISSKLDLEGTCAVLDLKRTSINKKYWDELTIIIESQSRRNSPEYVS